jgi:hypothetical protein
MTAKSILDREFLEMRCRLIDLASSMDRIERGYDAGEVAADPRMQLLRDAVRVLGEGKQDRAERMQMHFSDEYFTGWQSKFGLAT